MSSRILPDDALEEQLRAYYALELGQPPSADAVWASLQDELYFDIPSETATTTPDILDPAASVPEPVLPLHGSQSRAPHQRPLLFRSGVPVVAAALLIAVFSAVLLGPFSRLGGHGAPSQIPPGYAVHQLTRSELWPGVLLLDVQMLSKDEGWAVGAHNFDTLSNESAILHYANGRWSASSDVFPSVTLTSISMLSSTEGWAAGYRPAAPTDPTAAPLPVLLHYSASHWTAVRAPGDGQIGQLSMLSPHDGWAVSYARGYSTPPHVSLLHYDGSTWSPANTGGMPFMHIAMFSSSEGWAAGLDGVIARFYDGMWTRWPTTAPGDIRSITMVSPTEGWMSGVAPASSADPSYRKPHYLFMLHFDGRDWRPVTLPALPDVPASFAAPSFAPGDTVSDIEGISMVSSTDGWAAGRNGGILSALYHYSGGKWELAPFAVNQPLIRIQMVSAEEGWAIGEPRHEDNFTTSVILHFVSGSWSVYMP